MRRAESVAPTTQPIPLSMIFLAALAVHSPLLLMKLPLKSYDANFHIFFASHYLHNWFDPWNSKWYAGFSQTTYPPLPQQWLALVSRITGLDMAYMAGSVCRHFASGIGRVSFLAALGKSARRFTSRLWLVCFLALNVSWFTPPGSCRLRLRLRFT